MLISSRESEVIVRTSKEQVRDMIEKLSRAIARRSVADFLKGVELQITEGIAPHGYSPVTVNPYKDRTWAISSIGPYTGAARPGVVRFCFVPISLGELVTTEVGTLITKFLDQMGRTLDGEELELAGQILAKLEQMAPERAVLAKKSLYKFAAIFRRTGLLAMQNYLRWAEVNDQGVSFTLATILHDLNGCVEPFFEPRTSEYLMEVLDDQ